MKESTPTQKTSKLQQAIEIIETLSSQDQEILINLLQKRLKQQRREELVQAVTEAREELAKGNIRSGTIEDLLAELDC